MFLEHHLDIIDGRLDAIEKALKILKENSTVSTADFESMQDTVDGLSPIVLRRTRDKCNVIAK